ncbi:PVC-type heme-binding CxxCH protein [Roseimicrobium sp. ORNL1]|uniref:PVC-type heme-binding CxxCH protein n=1 Tax=Roseimicrobium sp. ORNL1 TaxID=2711231 RepID=UPI001F117120|nr:PVC-type heme-binding CxxCH protein [Roseimicrobium sp. ORNL1]
MSALRKFITLIASGALAGALPAAEVVKQKIDVLQAIKAGKVTYNINQKQTLHDPPDKIFTLDPKGQLKVSGNGFGYVRTNEDYQDYHLVIDFMFTGPTMGSREGKARDNGLLVHSHGPDGAYGGTWMASIEAQIIEGGVGDILVLSPKLEDGTEVVTSLSSELTLDRDKEKIWKKGEPRQTVTKGRINWEKRDVDWKDVAGFRGKDDVESRVKEWTRLEVIAKGDTLQYFVNGVLVNEAFDCKPSSGKICLQTEGAEMVVKRFELYPLGEFKEKWDPVQASGGSDIDVKASRETSWTPEQTQKSIELDGPYEVQLVAAEPLVRDPVEMTWDAQGRCYVADMIDYPLGGGPGKPPLSRIQQLIDDNGDGQYDRAITFADKVDHVQGLLPFRDGLVATTRTQILFIRDTNGDGVADERKPLVDGFNPNHSQLQVSAPRWGLDNCIYFNNGLDTKEIYPAGSPDAKSNFTRCNLRYDPATGKLEPTTGFGQFGGCFDDWGRHFFSSNRNPVMFAVMPYEAVIRNPNAGITQGWEDIAAFGAETRVYPLQLTHTTADAHAGTNTAACGLGVYRGDLMPELKGNIFVPDPTGQLITRYIVEPNGASLKATRVGDHKEFFGSHDEWCRPVNITTGPDGALYVCDMYRRYIDHARFFPESFVKTHDIRQGENEGRIWRIVPKKAKESQAAPASPKGGQVTLTYKSAADGFVLEGRIVSRASLPAEIAALKSRIAKEGLVVRGGKGLAAVEIQELMKSVAQAGVDNIKFSSISDEDSAVPVPAPSADRFRAPRTVEGLVRWLGHPNAWQRETAQRLLVEQKAKYTDVFNAVKPGSLTPLAGLHITCVMRALVPKNSGELNLNARIQGSIDKALKDVNAGNVLFRTELPLANDHIMSDSTDAVQSSDGRRVMLGILGTDFKNRPQDGSVVVTGATRFAEDPWIQRAVLAATSQRAGTVLSKLLENKAVSEGYTVKKSDFVRALAASCATDADADDFSAALSSLKNGEGKLAWWKPALLQGLSEGLPKSGGKLGVKSLAQFTATPPEQYKAAAAEITALLGLVDKVMVDAKAPAEQRLACIPLLAQRSWDKAEPVMRTLLDDSQPLEISTAAFALLKKFGADKTATLLYELLPKLGPTQRLEVVKLLTSNGKTVKDFFERIDRGELPKAFVDAETRWRYLRPGNPMFDLATKIFGSPSGDRAAVITAYHDAIKTKGDSAKGQQVFSTICITCHKVKGLGVDVGPDITDVRIKEKEALLSDILDPNRMVEARWMAYQIDTKDGRVVAGLIAGETSTEVTVKMAGGITEVVPRANIAKMKSLDASLMPVGLEGGITKEQMADLLAFLKGE